jgi:hypothetical protein
MLIMSKSKGPRKRTQQRRRRVPWGADDFTETPFGYMARWDRFISMRNLLSPEEHDEMVTAFLSGAPDLRREQQARRTHLLQILNEADPVNLLVRASLTYLHMDPDTFKEWESDRSPAHIEYLALQALSIGLSAPKEVDPRREWELTGEAVQIVREMFRSASMLMVMDAIAARRDRPDDATIEYALKTRLESLGVRGTGYSEHLVRVIHGCFDPFDQECRRMIGFTASEALRLTDGIAGLISDRMEPLWKEAAAAREQMLRQLKRERRSRNSSDRRFPDWLLDLPPNEAKLQISAFATTWLFSDSRSLAVMTPEDLASHCSIDVPACRAFLDAFTCPPELFNEEHHAFPSGAHPLTDRPVLRVEEGFVVPVASSMIDAIRPRMEDLLSNMPVWERYVSARGKYVEREATALLSSALPGSRQWNGIKWRSTNDGSDLDGLVAADDFAIRLQCKAGRLTAPARRGAPGRMKRDIGDLIEAAAGQHRALAIALSNEGATSIGFTDEQAAALNAPLQLEAVVCLDDVTVWATETHELRRVGALPADRHVPWVLSLTDLMAVTDLLQGAELVHYLLRRQRIERDGRIEAHDELDWVGHYLKEGLYFDNYFDEANPPNAFRLLSYTEPIDAWYFTRAGLRTIEAPKPTQGIPQNLHFLIQRLEHERPRHWILAAVALLNGDEESRANWDKAIAHARERVPEVGWSNATQGFSGRLGVTFYVDLRTEWPEIRARVAHYCRTKAEELDQANWIGIGEGASGGLFVILIERRPELPLTSVFLQPPPVRPDALVTASDQESDGAERDREES